MTGIVFVIFFAVVVFFTNRVVSEVKEDCSRSFGFPNTAKKYFSAEKSFFKKFIIFAVIATISILIFKKFVVVFALGVLHVICLFFMYKLYKNAKDNVTGKNERFAVLLFSAEKFMIIIGLIFLIANLVI